MTVKNISLDEKIKDLESLAIDQIKEYKASKKDITELLDFMSNFYKYSVRNNLLIKAQWSGAVAVESYKGWQKLGTNVKKGEKSKIKILVPVTSEVFKGLNGKNKSIKYATAQEQALIQSGTIKTTKRIKFIFGSVFDITQTELKPEEYPKLFPNRHFNNEISEEEYNKIYSGLKSFAANEKIELLEDSNRDLGNAKGAYFPELDKIKMNPLNSKIENITVLIHELGHAEMHKNSSLKTEYKELQAEMVSYLVSKYLGFAVEEESVKYINSWNGNLDKIEDKELEKLLNQSRQTAKKIIESL